MAKRHKPENDPFNPSPDEWFEIWFAIKRALNQARLDEVRPVNLREECPELFIYSAN